MLKGTELDEFVTKISEIAKTVLPEYSPDRTNLAIRTFAKRYPTIDRCEIMMKVFLSAFPFEIKQIRNMVYPLQTILNNILEEIMARTQYRDDEIESIIALKIAIRKAILQKHDKYDEYDLNRMDIVMAELIDAGITNVMLFESNPRTVLMNADMNSSRILHDAYRAIIKDKYPDISDPVTLIIDLYNSPLDREEIVRVGQSADKCNAIVAMLIAAGYRVFVHDRYSAMCSVVALYDRYEMIEDDECEVTENSGGSNS